MSARLIPLVTLVALTACSYDFQRSSEVIDRRILAIQVDPPELAGGTALPDSVKALALVVDPADPLGAAEVSWAACLLPALSNGNEGDAQNKRCPEGDSTLRLPSNSMPLSSVGLTLPVPPDVVGLLGSGSDIPAAQIQMELSVSSDQGELVAVKEVAVTAVLPEGQEPNRNPVVKGLTLDGTDWLPDTPRTITYGACPDEKKKEVEAKDKSLVRVCEHEIEPLFDESESQFYNDRGFSGETELQRERLRFAWFTDAGSWRHDVTRQYDPRDPSPDNVGPQSFWREPPEKTERSTLWVVVRDGRGGTSWERREVLFQ
ncbi:MAG: hypothetical protein ACJ8AT_03820 [Hyalangium sp.]|uniref:hypothetical protein n=1 Tax=Hyalangium sp. TaxID=2028555 RepID=UPI00389A0318